MEELGFLLSMVGLLLERPHPNKQSSFCLQLWHYIFMTFILLCVSNDLWAFIALG
jgi:hypothetical protein